MKITVREMSWKEHFIEVDLEVNVKELKKMIFEKSGVHPLFQRLYWGHIGLDDEMKLSDLSIML